MQTELTIVGGGLAGCEAAWQAAKRGISVTLYEMRPQKMTEAHKTGLLGELVCSNSLGSTHSTNGSGLLFNEMKVFNSIICQVAEESAVPAGSALAVDRTQFAEKLTNLLISHPLIKIIHEEVGAIPQGPCIITSGPLTSLALITALQDFHGEKNLFFYDAIAPIMEADSIEMQIAFRGSRYGKSESDEGDYLNCPLDKEAYEAFVEQLISAQQIELKSFEQKINQGVDAGYGHFFEGCLPIEILARRGINTLAYGPLRPVGLRKSYKGTPPYAIVQLRQDDISQTTYNMVGFQTNLTFSEQKRVFRMIPGLQNAEFIRYGQMHRNTYLFAPSLINQHLQTIHRSDLFFAGQLIGVEGYLGNAATGLVAGINAANFLKQKPLLIFPMETMIGALCFYVSHAEKETFQPMKANFGILPPITPKIKNKSERKIACSNRSLKMIKSIYTKEP
ncbi:MAG: methylenetetrahydrofolate--tRNA-(uracil(54)-C(5))-methyltransferase (FADH(2)-oxidizing) TrmFO [Anaerolineaceae bacterium]